MKGQRGRAYTAPSMTSSTFGDRMVARLDYGAAMQ
jgi:hypothetical protein